MLHTISQEVISPRAAQRHRAALLKAVTELRTALSDAYVGTSGYSYRLAVFPATKKLDAWILERFGIKVQTVIGDVPWDDAWVSYYQMRQGTGSGDPSVTAQPKLTQKVLERHSTVKTMIESTIDLEQVKVDGKLSQIEFTICLSRHLIENTDNSDEEITAVFVHELGHTFMHLITLADTVWYNYALTEGVEVLLGRKPNRYKLELLNTRYLAKHVSNPEVLKAMEEQRSAEAYRLAVLDALQNHRYANTSHNTIRAAHYRSEQTADQFAARMGFGAAMVKFLDRWHRRDLFSDHRPEGMIMTLLRYGLVGLAPLFLIKPVSDDHILVTHTPYEAGKTRLESVMRDLIAQLRSKEISAARRTILLEEIADVKDVLRQLHERRPLIENLMRLTSAKWRKNDDLYYREKELELLLNNDLFFHSAQAKQLA